MFDDTEGMEIWVAAENMYNEQVARVENRIIARLHDKLATARNANKIFRVFLKFNALFMGSKVRCASNLTVTDTKFPD
jgi:dynein heavy chain 1